MNIWHVDNKIWTKLRLWRSDNENFRIIEAGTYQPILVNAAYTLIKSKYGSVFKELKSQVIMTPVIIHDYLHNTKCDEYIELKVLNDINVDTINHLDSAGKKVWKFFGDLFVTGSIKEEMLRSGNDELSFSLGFSRFGGMNSINAIGDK